MPLLDIATPQPSSFRNNLYSLGFQRLHHVSGNRKTARWRYFRLSDKPNRVFYINPASLETCRGRLMINAVATLEPRCSDKVNGNAQQQQLPIDSTINLPATDSNKSSPILDEKEMLRRKRISKANKGKDAWNKGRKHSPETLQKIRERTKLAMQSPTVKVKLLRGVHEQSHETRLKIGAAVRRRWKKIHGRLAGCHLEWLNLIAEASRKGLYGEEELQWDSYEIISQQLEKEYLEGVAARNKPKGGMSLSRLPKSLEQRRKISEAIAAKWADPAYRDRVQSGMAKYRGNSSETRPARKATKEPKKIKPVKRDDLNATKIRNSRPNLKTSKRQIPKKPWPRYKDPEAGHKLEMIKGIRAQRAASNPKIKEAITRAHVLIEEAQRAAEALEAAAAKSPMAEASLVETRKLIAEAISYIKSLEMVNNEFPGSGSDENVKTAMEGVSETEQRGVNGVGGIGLSDAEIAKMVNFESPQSGSDKEVKTVAEGVSEIEQIGVNGVGGVGAEIVKFGEFSKVVVEDEDVVVNGTERIDLSAAASSSSSSSSSGLQTKEAEEDGGRKMASEKEGGGKGKGRRWVCGRLVEDDDEY